MKRFIIGMMSMVMLVGCAGPSATISDIREGGPETFWQGLTYDQEQEDVILFSDLEKEFKKNNINLIEDPPPDVLRGLYKVEDDRVSIRILLDELTSPGRKLVSDIFIEPRNNYMLLSEHPAVKIIASFMGEEKVLTWVADRESEMTEASKSKEDIQDVLAVDRCYLYFEYRPRSDTRQLSFSWAFKPRVPQAFKEIAGQLEDNGLLTTGYIVGLGGETLTATNKDYYLLNQIRYFDPKKVAADINQAAAYRVMHDTSRPDTYSIQLHGYMSGDLAHPAQVEAMPGLEKITQRMNMGREEFLAITNEINKELTEAKRVRNNVYKGEYYVEGEVGEYRYIITVPSGVESYNFTVLMEKI